MKISLNSLYIFIAFFLYWSCTSDHDRKDITSNILKLRNKTSKEVNTILGTPDTSYTKTFFKKRYFIQFYNAHQTEIRFLDDTVAQVIINNPYPLKFEPETIEKFGIKYRNPDSYDSLAMITWKNIEGMKAISFFLVGTKKPEAVAHNYKIFFNMEK